MNGGRPADRRVAGYLGRILDDGGQPVGTCFQLAPGVLVTAWHVLDEIEATAEDAQVRVDPLAGGAACAAQVRRLDPVHDLAVLTSNVALPMIAGRLTATDEMALRAGVSVTGHAVPADPGHAYQFLTAPGEWAGGTTRDDAVPLGRMISNSVVLGMSGAPVIRDSDGAVAGVVSGRYNSQDGWLAGTVWVARTEDLHSLLTGLADVPMQQAPLGESVDLLLTVTSETVQLAGSRIDVTARHEGVRPGLAEAVHEARRARTRTSQPVRTQSETIGLASEDASLRRAGRLLGESFLPGPVSRELDRVLAAAARAHQPVRIGLQVPSGLAGLPWEALAPLGGEPLVLHPLVSFYRKTDTVGGRRLAGPLRIVVAIAAPDTGSGPLLDYERELRNVLAAVRAARQDAADVRVVPFATPAAIRAELDQGVAHILHISGHGSPGRLDLENEDGTARPVTAGEFLREAIPPGRMPPVISLAACYTDAAAESGTSFAATLCAHGAAAVIATETSVTDIYATRLLARFYATLASANDPDVITALCAARRDVQTELDTSPNERDRLLAELGEWAAVTVLAATGEVPVLDPAAPRMAVAAGRARPAIAGLAGRSDWYFVGRRAEQRRWPAELTDTPGLAGIVVSGIGGTGKTTLAAELTTRILDREPSRILISLTGPLTLEALLGAVTSGLRRHLLVHGSDGDVVRALDTATRADLPWPDRYAILRDHVLDTVPVLLLLDNFEDNLTPIGGMGYAIADQAVAGLLAAWVADPGGARLLITSRFRFTLPGDAERYLSFRRLGALSRAEAMKLAWSLPNLDTLDEHQLEQVWRLAGGHPRSLEYLDALLAGGTARYPDVTARLDKAVTRRLDGADRRQWLAARTGLDAALAETIALAADDVLLGDLLTRLAQVPGALALLTGASVYREPIDTNALLFQAGQPDPTAEDNPDRSVATERIAEILTDAGITISDSLDLADVPDQVLTQLEPYLADLNRPPLPPFRSPADLAARTAACQAASLLSVSGAGQEQRFFVHRWTATELATRRAGPRLDEAHRQAAAYWQWRVAVCPQSPTTDVHDLLEARYHLLASGDTSRAAEVAEDVVDQLHRWGAWDQEASLIHDTLSRLPQDSSRQAVWIFQLGVLAHDRGDYDEAERQYQRALTINEQIDDQAALASTYHQLGMLAHRRGKYDEAERQYQRALTIKEQTGNQASMASTYHQLGMLAQFRGKYDEAERQYKRALTINEQTGSQAGLASTYHQLGRLAEIRGDYDEAERQYQRSLAIEERLGNQAALATSYHQLGMLAQLRGDYGEAERQYRRALAIDERTGNQASLATTYHQLGTLAQLRGDYDEAERQYQRSLAIEERLGNQAGLAASYSQLGLLEAERGGDTELVLRLHLQAFTIRLQLGVPEVGIDLRYLAAHRARLGTGQFTTLLVHATGEPELAEQILSILDQLEAASGST